MPSIISHLSIPHRAYVGTRDSNRSSRGARFNIDPHVEREGGRDALAKWHSSSCFHVFRRKKYKVRKPGEKFNTQGGHWGVGLEETQRGYIVSVLRTPFPSLRCMCVYKPDFGRLACPPKQRGGLNVVLFLLVFVTWEKSESGSRWRKKKTQIIYLLFIL